MSIAVKLYTFSKRENSTAQPSGGTQFDCDLKGETSIINPTIVLHASDISGYNYAYIDSFGRYYFMRDITSIANNLWSISLEVDAMATYKTEIGGSTEYVLRSASSYDGDIVDSLYPTKGNTDLLMGSYTATAPFAAANTGGIAYILGAMNHNTTNHFGAVQYYDVDITSWGNLMGWLLGLDSGLSATDELINKIMSWSWEQSVKDSIAIALGDPIQYIIESYALPYKPLSGGSTTNVMLGPMTAPSGVSGTPIQSTSTQFPITSGDLVLPDHPQKNDRGPYLNLSPFMKYWLYLGPFGIYPLDANTVYSNRTVHFQINGDLFGNVTCVLYVDSKEIDVLHANVKCNFPVGQVSTEAYKGAIAIGGTVVSMGAAAAAGNPMGLITGYSGIISAAEHFTPKGKTQGSQGSFVNVFDKFYAYAEAQWVIDDDNAQRGRPLCKPVQISTLSGYILVSDPDIAISGTAEENSKIKQYMSTGFFYE